MRQQTVEGIVINRSNLGEADRLITLFTENQGKLIAVARGVRRLSSRRAGSLELFNLVRAQVITGRGEIDTLAEVQVLQTFKSWRGQLGRVNLAYQLCEAVDKLTPSHQPYPQIFNVLVTALSQIASLGRNWEEQMRIWLVEILRDLGYWPKDELFVGDIFVYIESISSRPYNSPRILSELK